MFVIGPCFLHTAKVAGNLFRSNTTKLNHKTQRKVYIKAHLVVHG